MTLVAPPVAIGDYDCYRHTFEYYCIMIVIMMIIIVITV